MAISAREIESRAFDIIRQCGFQPNQSIDLKVVADVLGVSGAQAREARATRLRLSLCRACCMGEKCATSNVAFVTPTYSK